MILVAQVIFAGICLIGIPAGIFFAIKHNGNLKLEMRPSPPAERRRRGRMMRDTHARVRQDDRFVDGFITGAALDELEDMFK